MKMAKTKKILKQMMIFSFSAALSMGNGICVSADSGAEENIPDDVILQTEQSQDEEETFFSSAPEIDDFSSGNADTVNKDSNNDDDEDDNKKGDNDTSPDINKLSDGIYSVSGTMLKTDKKTASMADQAFNHTIKLTVKDGKYKLTLDFRAMDMNGQMGYLGNIRYYKTGYTLDKNGNPEGETADTKVDALQKYKDDTVVSDYFGTDYPDIVTFSMIKEAWTDSYVPLQVFIPIMDEIAKGTGTQNVFLKMDWSTLKETTEEDEAFKDDSSNGDCNNGNNNGNSNGNNNGNNNSGSNGNNNIGNNGNNSGNISNNNGSNNNSGNNGSSNNNNNNGNNNGSANNGADNSGYVNNAGLGGNSSLKKNNSGNSGTGNGNSLSGNSSTGGNSSLNGNRSLSGNSSLKLSGNSGTGTTKTSGSLSSENSENGALESTEDQDGEMLNTLGTQGNFSGMSNDTGMVSQVSVGSQTEQLAGTTWEMSTQQSSAKKAGAMVPVWISAVAVACGLGYKIKTGTSPKRRKKR